MKCPLCTNEMNSIVPLIHQGEGVESSRCTGCRIVVHHQRKQYVDPTALPEDIVTQIWDNEPTTNMSVEEAFEAWCSYEGLLGYSGKLIRVLDAIRASR